MIGEFSKCELVLEMNPFVFLATFLNLLRTTALINLWHVIREHVVKVFILYKLRVNLDILGSPIAGGQTLPTDH